ncbi:MAG: hypothetical protein A2020_05130 [Lentisphaerae bacterium GWF2_45_14]|nr:MAG: hypothetical protein A2020_05130 [Lentisphaerae bacterium GWF2_45_14]
MIRKIFFLVLLALAPFVQASDKKRIDSILASVDGEPISLLDVIYESGRDEARLAMVFRGDELFQETRKLRKKILDGIINRKLIYEDYKSNPFKIPEIDQYIEATVDGLSADFGDGSREALIEKAKKSGTSLDELKEKARKKIIVDIMVNEYCGRSVYVTPKDTYEYYEAHKDEFSTPASVELDMILIKKDGKHLDSFQSVIDEIKESTASGNRKIFKTLAVINSEGPNAENGGEIGSIEVSRLRPEFLAGITSLSPGSVAGPIETDEGIYFLYLVSKKDKEGTAFDKVESSIRDSIQKKFREKAYVEYIEKLREKAIIRYYF